ncbi:hypothetical protein BRAO375_3450004 [Bradyrhizobium sp. ORS 375]|uniref:hypothetical protein n=1 Tax=Bradyrhizobium sp. (strain ORS 375) TaxID=566679 RepID=UPI0002405E2B|nr:hypothetical protein [Bradyrhizobium sp. ORS 375]CCD94321.1 hypothetical protein BRAO375_3450004 [Bradyrhizobium sp. ORS 375]
MTEVASFKHTLRLGHNGWQATFLRKHRTHADDFEIYYGPDVFSNKQAAIDWIERKYVANGAAPPMAYGDDEQGLTIETGRKYEHDQS